MGSTIKRILAAVVVLAVVVAAVLLGSRLFFHHRPPLPLDTLRTVAGLAPSYNAQPFGEVFGIAVSPKGVIYAGDGVKGMIWEIGLDGAIKPLATGLATPSGIALSPDGNLVVADSGSHTIQRVNSATGEISLLAGAPNQSGFVDGEAAAARFNAPVGVAVGADGVVYVADTYNDRIRKIDREGMVSTMAGGDGPGFADSPSGSAARFDTPGGIAVTSDGAVVVADTGNRRIRRVGLDGAVTTIAGSGEYGDRDGVLADATFAEPIGVAVDPSGSIYVADASANSVRVCQLKLAPIVVRMAGNGSRGLVDGPAMAGKLNRPSSVALAPNGEVVIADTGNRLVRILSTTEGKNGKLMSPAEAKGMRPTADEFRAAAPGRWPFEPGDQPREIAATFGEIRGKIGPDAPPAHFHNGLDIPGAYGETARAVRTEKVLQLLPVSDINGVSEYLRLATMGYIHIRIGRDRDGKPIAPDKFQIIRNEGDPAPIVRVRRGTVINAGDPIGTLNNQNHCHLIAGPPGFEMNALAALVLPGIRDTVSPVIESDGVHFYDESWKEFSAADNSAHLAKDTIPIEVRGRVRIVVDAFDQMDGDADRRRLGVYQLGYEVNPSGRDFVDNATVFTLSFAELPDSPRGPSLVYGPGSVAGARPPTIFAYIVTDHMAGGTVNQDFWDTTKLSPGDYVVRVTAADFFGNKTFRDVTVRVVAPSN